MSNDLISRSALERELLEKGFYPAIVRAAIEKAPAVDAEIVRRGHWISRVVADIPDECFAPWCSVCKAPMFHAISLELKYCPNCGAKMNEEVENA